MTTAAGAPAAPQTATQSRPVTWAPVPKVNLLPVEILENRSFRRTQYVLAGAVLVVVGATGAVTGWAQTGVNRAQSDADDARAEVVRLQTVQAEYASVPQVVAQVTAAQTARAGVYAGDVLWSRYLTRIDRARPEGVELQTLTASVTGTTAAATTDVLTPSGIGSLEFAATGSEYVQASAWLEAVDAVNGLDGATLTGAAKSADSTDAGALTFTSTSVLTDDATSGRFQDIGIVSTDATDDSGGVATSGDITTE